MDTDPLDSRGNDVLVYRALPSHFLSADVSFHFSLCVRFPSQLCVDALSQRGGRGRGRPLLVYECGEERSSD